MNKYFSFFLTAIKTITDAKWADLSMTLRKAGGRPLSESVKEEFLLSFQPSMVIMPIEEAGPKVAFHLCWSPKHRPFKGGKKYKT